jgi:hypothetical protein
VIKVYSVTFSCIFEREKEQRLSLILVSFLHKLETKLKYACKFQRLGYPWMVGTLPLA